MDLSIPTDKELLAFSKEHLVYELDMLFGSVADLVISKEKFPSSVRNSLVESFTVHARAILFFFYPGGTVKPDDALAKHFLKAEKDWNEVRPALPGVLSVVQRRVGKEIAHLTYARIAVSDANKVWHFKPILLAFIKISRVFSGVADPKKLHNNVIESINFWMEVFVREGVLTKDQVNGVSGAAVAE